MKKDPYSNLGLDQMLFRADQETTKQHDNETTLPRDIASTKERENEESSAPATEASRQRSAQRRNEATRPPASTLRGQKESVRLNERHSHDIFQDQVRWMNRLKLELVERYGRKVTSNALVQLAIDNLRRDYELERDRSDIIRVLVRQEPPGPGPESEEGS